MTTAELLSAVTLLQQLAEQARRAELAWPANLEATWNDLERRLLRGLRAEERAASPAGSDPVRELKAIGANERIRNLVWEVSISIQLASPRPGAMLKLAELLRARALARSEEPRMHPAA
jgi:hypothetical protein